MTDAVTDVVIVLTLILGFACIIWSYYDEIRRHKGLDEAIKKMDERAKNPRKPVYFYGRFTENGYYEELTPKEIRKIRDRELNNVKKKVAQEFHSKKLDKR